ncbi:unnamed protein product [Lampetra planeri]
MRRGEGHVPRCLLPRARNFREASARCLVRQRGPMGARRAEGLTVTSHEPSRSADQPWRPPRGDPGSRVAGGAGWEEGGRSYGPGERRNGRGERNVGGATGVLEEEGKYLQVSPKPHTPPADQLIAANSFTLLDWAQRLREVDSKRAARIASPALLIHGSFHFSF